MPPRAAMFARPPFAAFRAGTAPATLVVVSAAQGYGGAERCVEVLAAHLPGDLRVEILATSPLHLERLRAIDRPGLGITRVAFDDQRPSRRAAADLVKIVRATRPVAIVVNTLDSLRILADAADVLPDLDARSFVHVHDFQWRDYDGLLARLPRATIVVPDATVLQRASYVARLIHPLRPRRAIVLPCVFAVPPQPTPPPGDDAPFLHLATVARSKGHLHLVDAAARLARIGEPVRVASYGHRPDPRILAEIEAHLTRSGCGDRLTLHDHVADPAPLLAACRAVVVTSVSRHGGPETFGRTIVEAWAYARPVVAFAAGTPRTLVRHEVDGLLVAEGDDAGLADALLRLHRDPALATRLGLAGHARARAEFASEVTIPRTLAILEGHPDRPVIRAVPRPPTASLGSRPRILLDLSQTLDIGWSTPVGMSRIEGDVAERLCGDADRDVVLVHARSDGTGFALPSPLETEALARRDGTLGARADADLDARWSRLPPRPPATTITRRLLAAWGARRLLAAWVTRRRARAVARVAAAMTGRDPVEPGAGDVLVCLANPWDRVAPAAVVAARRRGARVVLLVHDVLVWETPHLTAGRDPRAYSDDMTAWIADADEIVAVSHVTARRVGEALASFGRTCPPITVAAPSPWTALPRGAVWPPDGFATERPFVVVCSTIEVRKNHLMLLHLWERLRTTLPPDRLPRLVFVGRWGWGVDAVRLAVERNWRLAPHVEVLEDLADDAVAWLYRHARFTLFPSHAEGFGLPVAESLSFGTPVIVSDLPALREASEDLMPALDPWDLPAWMREVAALCADDARLAALRDRARLYRGTGAADLRDAIVAAIDRAAAKVPADADRPAAVRSERTDLNRN